MWVKNAQKVCAALALGTTMAIAFPLKSVAASLSYEIEITWKDLYPNNDVVFSFVGEDIDEDGLIGVNNRNGNNEVLSFELVGLEELGGGAVDLEMLWFDLSSKEFTSLSVSNDRFGLDSFIPGVAWLLRDSLGDYNNIVFSAPVVTAVATEQPSFEQVATEPQAVPEPSTILGSLTVLGVGTLMKKKVSKNG